MSDRKTINLKISSKDFELSQPSCFSFDLKVSLLSLKSDAEVLKRLTEEKKAEDKNQENNIEPSKNVFVPSIPKEDENARKPSEGKWEEEDDEDDKNSVEVKIEDNNTEDETDLLEITINGLQDIPEDVSEHIKSRIGNYELKKDESKNETTLIFDVNFSHVNRNEVFKSYFKFFEQERDYNSKVNISYAKKGNMKELLESFVEKKEIPLVLHLMEKSELTLDIDSPEFLLVSTINFMKKNFNEPSNLLELLIDKFQAINGKMVLGDINKFDISFWRNLNLDQTQNFGGFFDLWRTPLLGFIFGEGEGKLKVKGTILKFVEYEFNMRILDFKNFLDELSQKFK